MNNAYFAKLGMMVAGALVAACTLKPPTAPEGPPPGTREDIVLPREQTLLYEAQGWRVLELTDNDRTLCVALKPVAGTPWPDFSTGTLWPRFRGSKSPDYRMVSGGAGFFMYAANDTDLPYFGFYGKYPFRLPSVAQLEGKAVAAVDDRDTVLAWEGREVTFTVFTKPSEESGTGEQASGAVSFTGVGEAYRRMMQCREQAHSWL